MDTSELVRRYVALWTEPDPAARRAAIAELFAPDGVHVLQPPAELRSVAAGLGFPAAALEARGHAGLAERVTRSYAEFVAPGRYTFRPRGDADRVRDVVKFRWEMVSVADGSPAGVGLEFLLLAPDGRIRADYQFIEA
jgi:hypothetical protein